VKYWNLKTGVDIAYIHIPASDPKQSIPVIFIHGGPGACQVSSFGKEAPIDGFLMKEIFLIFVFAINEIT
jgi:hypothetical protein